MHSPQSALMLVATICLLTFCSFVWEAGDVLLCSGSRPCIGWVTGVCSCLMILFSSHNPSCVIKLW